MNKVRQKILFASSSSRFEFTQLSSACNVVGFGADSDDWMRNFKLSNDGQFSCNLCFSKTKHKRNAYTHFVQRHLEAFLEFECPVCHKMLKTRNILRSHVLRRHNQSSAGLDTNACMRHKLSDYLL